MTKEEWKKIADWWGTGYGSVKMNIDGHEISLYNTIDKKKMIVEVAVYIDGYMKSEYSNIDNEIGKRFLQHVRKPLYSAKKLKEYIKVFGKRSKMAQQKYYEYNIPCWRSFALFKRHIMIHNTNIVLIQKSEVSNEQETF